MPTFSFDVTFKDGHTLAARVSMTGPCHTFGSGKHGFKYRDTFDWGGRSWCLRFTAFKDAASASPTVIVQKRGRADQTQTKATALAPLLQRIRANQEKKAAGWRVEVLPDGIQAWFDMAAIRTLPSKKEGSFASFEVEIEGTAFLGEFHLLEVLGAAPKPISWDWSPGAKAGLPTLGKRR